MNPGGGSKTVSRWDIQQVCSRGIPAQQHARDRTLQLRAPELADLGLLDAPPELVHEQLHAVADAHHRHAQLQQAELEARGSRRVDRRGTARQDDPARLPPRDLLERHVWGAAPRTRRSRESGARSAANTARHSRERRPLRGLRCAGGAGVVSGTGAVSVGALGGSASRTPPGEAGIDSDGSVIDEGGSLPVGARPCPRPGRAAAPCPRSAARARSRPRRD